MARALAPESARGRFTIAGDGGEQETLPPPDVASRGATTSAVTPPWRATPRDRPSASGREGAGAAPRPGDRVAGRYTLEERIGQGSQGEVWTAHDALLGERCALKWLGPHASGSAGARREIAMLRMLRVPGVVELIDEGVDGGRAFVVMEHVHGAPFPGPCGTLEGAREGTDGAETAQARRGAAARWARMERTALALLETLGRVHAAGVIHRDLKPANVLVRRDGQPIVLDFGVSRWSADGPVAEVAGTPAYMAPEQIGGASVDARADLFAVGAMIYEALGGSVPHLAGSVEALLLARRCDPAAPLSSVAPDAPPHVASAVDRLLAPRPGDRFRTAAEAIAALRGAQSPPASRPRGRAAARSAPASERALRALFAGPDRLFHLREDAARALWEAARGDPSRVEAEIEAWERLGLARRDGDRLALDRAALARLSALRLTIPEDAQETRGATDEARGATDEARGATEEARAAAHRARAAALGAGEEGRLYHLLAAGERAAAAAEARETGRARAWRGDVEGAAEALVLGLSALRASDAPTSLETALLSELAKVALVEATPGALDRALYELSRARSASAEATALGALLRAALDAPGPLGTARVLAVPRFADPALERRRLRMRAIAAAARTSPELLDQALVEARAWAAASDHPMAALSLAEGTALLRYAEGRFEEAARLHLETARLEPSILGKLVAVSNAASAFLEAFLHDEAARHAREARRLAAELRVPHGEGRAEWLLRAARYRAGEALSPDLELVEAIALVGVPTLTAVVCLTEAAVALRAGDMALTAELSDRAARTWRRLDRPAGTLLANCLAAFAGVRREGPESGSRREAEIVALCAEASACAVPGVGLQALGLLCAASPSLRSQHTTTMERLASGLPREHRSLRMDVLSADEALSSSFGSPKKATKVKP